MGKILVTGASGHIGKLTIEKLLEKKVPADQIIGLVRDPSKAADLANLGIELRQGDYSDPASLLRAFEDVEKLMLISTHAFTDRIKAHSNVVQAAVETGVKHIFFMPIMRKEGSDFLLKEVTKEDIATEKIIKDSGLTYTLLRHPPFIDTLPDAIGGAKAFADGVRVPKGSGKVRLASREDLAEAHAVVLTTQGHEGKTYWLGGDQAVSFAELAPIFSEALGKKIPLVELTDEEYVQGLAAGGMPAFVGEFLLGWMKGINRGEWSEPSGDLEHLLGRKPKTPAEYFIKGS